MGDYRDESAKSQKRRDDKIAAFWQIPDINDDELPNDLTEYARTSGLLSEEEVKIVYTDAVTLVAQLKAKELTSVAVTKAFCKAAVIAQKLTNCVTEVMFEDGLKRAQELDDYYASTGKTSGPLHGLPISIKDCFSFAPYPSSIGVANFANKGMPKDSVIVEQLKSLGAVLYVKTNVPTMMLLTETNNNIWGETRNPRHKKLTPGVPIPWRKDVIQPKGRKLRFGIIKNNDKTVTCHPPVERALKEVREKIEKAGHDIVEWDSPCGDDINKLLMTSFRRLAGDYAATVLGAYNEPPVGALVKKFVPGAQATNVGIDAAKLREIIITRNTIQKDFLDKWMATKTETDGPIDGLIYPVNPYAAPPLNWTRKREYLGYTTVYNVLDYSCCVFPVTTVDKAVDAKRGSDWTPISDYDKEIQDDYDPEFYHGAPVSLQMVTRRFEEEKAIELVDVVSKLL
ncbi:hypothetical protein KEM56_002558 [Ascosphaera pollenicola]|nr:hypothetical protein KEM56_002558 [Ascosphaera pollenicola]